MIEYVLPVVTFLAGVALGRRQISRNLPRMLRRAEIEGHDRGVIDGMRMLARIEAAKTDRVGHVRVLHDKQGPEDGLDGKQD